MFLYINTFITHIHICMYYSKLIVPDSLVIIQTENNHLLSVVGRGGGICGFTGQARHSQEISAVQLFLSSTIAQQMHKRAQRRTNSPWFFYREAGHSKHSAERVIPTVDNMLLLLVVQLFAHYVLTEVEHDLK